MRKSSIRRIVIFWLQIVSRFELQMSETLFPFRSFAPLFQCFWNCLELQCLKLFFNLDHLPFLFQCFCMCGLNHKNARVNPDKQIHRKGKCHLHSNKMLPFWIIHIKMVSNWFCYLKLIYKSQVLSNDFFSILWKTK